MLVWVRYRPGSAAMLGPVEWREEYVPDEYRTKKAQEKWLDEACCLGDTLLSELMSRDVYWEIAVPSAHLIRSHISTARRQIENLEKKVVRLASTVGTSLEPVPHKTKKCRDFPACGCLKESKRKDCRNPFQS